MPDESSLIVTLKERFLSNPHRHQNLTWPTVETWLLKHPENLTILSAMEETGGEPDVVSFLEQYYYCDCSAETPIGRRNLCFDEKARLNRKKFPPVHDALSRAKEMGITLLDEMQYHTLQALEPIDLKTSSWLATPESIRSKGHALFGEHRVGKVFIYHNGADSYFSVRGFRGCFSIL